MGNFKDIRYNRQYKMQDEGLSKNKITIIQSYAKVERYKNILLHIFDIKVKDRYYDFRIGYNLLIIISEMDVVKTIKLHVYD